MPSIMANTFLLRPNGKRQRGERMHENTLGEMIRPPVRIVITTVMSAIQPWLDNTAQLATALTAAVTRPATYGNGARIGTIAAIIQSVRTAIRKGHPAVHIVFCAAVLGTSMPTTCAVQTATTTILTTAATVSGFVVPVSL